MRAKRSAVLDLFVYIESCAPDDFPDEDEADLEGVFEELRAGIAACAPKRASPDVERYLQLGKIEVEEAFGKYKSGDNVGGLQTLSRARGRFEAGWRGRTPATSFVSGVDGLVVPADEATYPPDAGDDPDIDEG